MMTNTCSGCGGDVPARRPSITGDHWCKKTQCQSQRQRLARARRRVDVARPVETDLVAYIGFAIHAPRVKCGQCGLVDAVNGYVHRTSEGGPCRGVGTLGATIGLKWIDVVHPDRVPKPEPVEVEDEVA